MRRRRPRDRTVRQARCASRTPALPWYRAGTIAARCFNLRARAVRRSGGRNRPATASSVTGNDSSHSSPGPSMTVSSRARSHADRHILHVRDRKRRGDSVPAWGHQHSGPRLHRRHRSAEPRRTWRHERPVPPPAAALAPASHTERWRLAVWRDVGRTAGDLVQAAIVTHARGHRSQHVGHRKVRPPRMAIRTAVPRSGIGSARASSPAAPQAGWRGAGAPDPGGETCTGRRCRRR